MKKRKGEENKEGISKDYLKKTLDFGRSAPQVENNAHSEGSKALNGGKNRIAINVNGQCYKLDIGGQVGEVSPSHTLAYTLRETLGLTGTKIACDHGACGACTVIMNGIPILSCMTLTVECDGKNIRTIEGLKDPKTRELDPLQKAFIDKTAFQCGFCTPGMIMTAKALLDKNPSPTAQEVKEALSGNHCRCISHYHVLEAVIGRSQRKELRGNAKGYRFVGRATEREDAVEIVTGAAKFIDDIKLPRMLHAKVLRSPFPHANIKSIDTRKAKALQGVKAVLTHENAPDWKAGVPRHIRVLDNKVRFVGDAVALVAAETKEIAEEALDLIDIKYELLPAVYDVEEAMKSDAPQLYPEFSGNILPPGVPVFGPKALQEIVIGDVEKGFREADFIIEETCTYEGIPNPLPIEPPGVIAKWEGPNELTIWSATQSVYMHRFYMQPLMGFPDIRSIGLHCGGSYGSKNRYTQPVFYAAALAKATGRPVKVCLTKEEQFGAFILRLGSRVHGRVGIRKDGRVTAMSGRWLTNTGAASHVAQGLVAVGCGEAQLMLRCANWDLKPKVVCTNRNASGAVRGFGGQELKCAFIPILTMALERANFDPVDFFKANFVRPGDGYYWREGNWWTCRGVDYSRAIEKGARVFGWKKKWKGWLKPTAVKGKKTIGVGVGVHGNADVGEDVSEAYVKLNPDASATIHVCISESGMGERSSVRKMVAEVLQLSLDRINLSPVDTLINPFDYGLVGSRGTYAVGSAVIAAAEDAKRKLFEQAAPQLKAKPGDLETRDGMIYMRERPNKEIPWIEVMGIDHTHTGFGRFQPDFSVPNFMMIFVEVEVDVETGKVALLRVVPTTDVGQIIDPLVLEGQLYGCLGSAGLDTALFEESVLDPATGRLLNSNMIDYKWRTFLDLPVFQNVTLETPFPTHRFKAIGVGEITSAPGPSAILMAVSNAIGKRIFEYPLTPDKILKALGKIN